MKKPYTGGCACGAMRYEIKAEPIVMNDCQCRDCQRRSGTGHGSYISFADRATVRTTGSPKTWDVTGDMGGIKHHAFCPECGTPVWLTFAQMPDIFAIHAASLDDPSRYRPQLVTFTSSAQDWDVVDAAIPQFPHMPE